MIRRAIYLGGTSRRDRHHRDSIGLLLPAINAAREVGPPHFVRNNLRQIALASQAFCSEKGTFPPGGVQAKPGDPMANLNGWNRPTSQDFSNNFTWPTLILPYMEMNSVYRMYNFSLPQVSRGERHCPLANGL